MSERVELEICVDSTAGALAAERGGADRVELCSALELDGLTPSAGAIRRTRELVGVELVVLVRPRAGDFVCDEAELAVMLADVQAAKELAADGVAIGCLTAEGAVDARACEALIAAARPMRVTFHRAFDACRDPIASFDAIAALGCDRLLTSGQAATAPEGSGLLRELVERSAGRVRIMPGGGVRAANAAGLVAATGVGDLHSSARTVAPASRAMTDEAQVREIARSIRLRGDPAGR